MKRRIRQDTYSYAVAWIAYNDEPTLTDIHEISGLISVALISDMYQIDSYAVARDILKFRQSDKLPKRLLSGYRKYAEFIIRSVKHD